MNPVTSIDTALGRSSAGLRNLFDISIRLLTQPTAYARLLA
jgi:hypothetical protein